MTRNFYDTYLTSMLLSSGSFQFLSDEIKVLLVTDQYVFDGSYPTIGALAAGDEFSGAGYTAGGITLTGKSRVDRAYFADNLSWASLTGDIAGAILYKAAGGAMIAHIGFDVVLSPAAEEFRINWGAAGVINLTGGA
jgi:hypothetical protein